MTLQQEIEDVYGQDLTGAHRARALQIYNEFMFFLDRGEVRAAEKAGGEWKLNRWVKKGILLGFQLGEVREISIGNYFKFFEKNTCRLKNISPGDGIRIAPGGSSIRDGAYIARGVVCMPPTYINVGAYVDEDTMIDSHALVGSCTQVGKRVHMSAGVQLGGMLEPISAMPVIIEDDVFLGGHCGVYDGTIVKRGAVIAPGVILTGSEAVYDTVTQEVYRKPIDGSLVIPEGAVVVPGTRPLTTEWAQTEQLSLSVPLIINYRDVRTSAYTALEESLR